MTDLYDSFKRVHFDPLRSYLTTPLLRVAFIVNSNGERVEFSDVQQLLLTLWENEINRFYCWLKPFAHDETMNIPPPVNEKIVKWGSIVKTAWRINPLVAICLRERFCNSADLIDAEIAELSKFSHIKTISSQTALSIFLKNSWKARSDHQLR